MKNITETFHQYKGWDFKIRCVQSNGIWYYIYKDVPNPTSPNGMKRLYLRMKGFSFVPIDEIIQKAKNFIEDHEDLLLKSLVNKQNILNNKLCP